MKNYPFFKYNMNIKTFFTFIVASAILGLGLYLFITYEVLRVWQFWLVYAVFLFQLLIFSPRMLMVLSLLIIARYFTKEDFRIKNILLVNICWNVILCCTVGPFLFFPITLSIFLT
ncbi:E3 ubiquitin-protein ligase AMFR [Listeria monocytogenes]|nr:E3 ubiquitin-protein ligase AMFR [Listeria monocytogenes]